MSLINNEAKQYSQFHMFVRSFLFSCYSSASIFFYSFFCVLTWPLPFEWRSKWMRYFLHSYLSVLKFLCHIDYNIQGLENIPADRNGIVLAKHQSAWETFLLPQLFPCSAVILKRELLWIPFFGWGLASQDPIAINRNNKGSAMQQILTKGKTFLEKGRWILMFPEGTRVPVGVVGHYKLGGARLASVTGYPVIPVAHNAGRFWPRRKFIKIPGTVTVIVGPLIESKGRTPEEVLTLTKTWIEEQMKIL